jgi:hypothetical protein
MFGVENYVIGTSVRPSGLQTILVPMIIQTNPEMFSRVFPVHTVTEINRATGIVSLSGSDGSTHQARLDSWGPWEETQPIVGR